MPRSRSRSPKRDRKRSRSRERSRERDRHRRRRSRSRDKGRRRSRSPKRSKSKERRHERDDRGRVDSHRSESRLSDGGRGPPSKSSLEEEEEVLMFEDANRVPATEEEIQKMPEEEQDMMRIMGFKGFDTTKDKQVVGNDHYAANICKKRRYRQYMNRKGGFNRPLDFIA